MNKFPQSKLSILRELQEVVEDIGLANYMGGSFSIKEQFGWSAERVEAIKDREIAEQKFNDLVLRLEHLLRDSVK